MTVRNPELIRVLRNAIFREQERIQRSEFEIWKLKMELLELGEELPLEESENIKPKEEKPCPGQMFSHQ